MPTDTFSISAAGNDGCGYREASLWSLIGAGTYTEFSDDASNAIFVEKIDATTIFYATLSYLRFDTSTLADDATITAAALKLFITTLTEVNDYSLEADYYDFGGEPTVAGDWVETVGASILASTNLTSLTTSAVNTVNISDLSGISKTGITGFRLALSAGEPTGDNTFGIAAFEHASQEPRLEVTYTSAPEQFRMGAKDFPKSQLARTV